jgi:7-cyano-7-deazaguanine synthase
MEFKDLQLPDVKKVALSLSGGLDSTTLLYCLVKKYGAENVYALSFDYNQKQSIELEKAKISCDKLGVVHKVINLSFLGDIVGKVSSNIKGSTIAVPTIQDVLGEPQPVTYIPFRNLQFTSMLLAFAEANECGAVALGIQAVDFYGYWDTTLEFVQAMQNICDLNRKTQITMCTPFVELTKVDEITIGTELGINYADTISCYDPNEHGDACGTCPTCVERIKAFATAGIIDPTTYQKELNWDNMFVKFKGVL